VTSNTLSLELPIPWVESWIVDPERRIGQRIDGRAGWGRGTQRISLANYRPIWRSRGRCPQGSDRQLGGLLALAAGSEIPATPGAARSGQSSGSNRPCGWAALRRTWAGRPQHSRAFACFGRTYIAASTMPA